MIVANERWLDALTGEYLLGTLRGAARRRYERALREEPLVAGRLEFWQGILTPRYSKMVELQPSSRSWSRLESELELARYRTPWYRKLSFWRGWAVATTAALVLAIAFQTLRPVQQPPAQVEIARLAGKNGEAVAVAAMSPDQRMVELRSLRAVQAGPTQSYELWLIPAEGGAAISIAVLGSLDAHFALPPAQVGKLRTGAKLAVTLEPAGGSPTGVATGPVLWLGEIKS
ncbi:MAG: anti-sigma factor [Betaproteobacteria bacterium]